MKKEKSAFAVLFCIFGLWSSVVGLSLSGCGYTTKSLLPAHIKTLYIANFKNAINITEETSDKRPYRLYKPALENKLTRAVVDRFILDGNLKIVKDKDIADAVLTGELTEYVREPLRYDDNQEVTEFRVRITAAVRFIDQSDKKKLWQEGGLVGESSQRTEGTLAKSEDAAVTEAVDDLSRRIVEKTIEVW
ncbi:MAG: LptE family protein [Candidatus Omnitrophota bacterium]